MDNFKTKRIGFLSGKQFTVVIKIVDKLPKHKESAIGGKRRRVFNIELIY
jgi:hypothetical protein